MTKMPSRTTTSQHGYIVLGLLLILVIGGSSLVLAGLGNRQSAYHKQQAELHREMNLAKQALLAYAASSSTLLGNQRGPGYLPCPDTATTDADNDGVVSDNWNTTCTSTLGRLPEAINVGGTRFLLNNYFAGIDQQFWYVVGPRYTNTSSSNSNTSRQAYRRTSVSASDTVAYNVQLELDNNSATRYVALIIAPGEALQGQDRSSNPMLYSNYLDGLNGTAAYDYYTSDATDPDNFNDQILGITVDEYIKAVGPVVARELKRQLDEYYTTTYPTSGSYDTEFPASAPSSSSQTNFRNIFNYNSVYAADIPIWLKRNSTAYPNTNGELWPNYIYYRYDHSEQGRFIFRGCPGLIFTIHHTNGISRSGSSCT